jgi:hypothetical protein
MDRPPTIVMNKIRYVSSMVCFEFHRSFLLSLMPAWQVVLIFMLIFPYMTFPLQEIGTRQQRQQGGQREEYYIQVGTEW